MKMAKSYKFILAIVSAVMFMLAVFAIFTPVSAKADVTISSYVNTTDVKAELDDDSLKFSVKNGGKVSFVNDLVVDDFAITFGEISEDVTEVKIEFTTDSFIVTGNKNADGKFDTQIVNTVYINKDNGVKLNDGEFLSCDLSGSFTVTLKVTDNFFGISTDGTDFTYETNSYYKVKTIDKTVATDIVFTFTVNGEEYKNVSILSIDQKASDSEGKYKQTFKLDATTGDPTYASPRIVLNDSFFVMDANGKYNVIVNNGTQYSLTTTVYSFFKKPVTASDIKIASEDNIITVYGTKKVQFNVTEAEANDGKNVTMSLKNRTSEVEYETYNVVVKDFKNDDTAPKYIVNSEALESYLASLKTKFYVEGEGEEAGHSIVLGNSMDLPSMKSLVYDDYSPYESLTFTVHYYGPSSGSTGTTSSLKFNLSEDGTYTYYVAFSDANKNAMETADFIEKNDADIYEFNKTYSEGGVNEVGGTLNNSFVFRFTVFDDAPLSVKSSGSSLARGKVNSEYTAVDFEISASGFNTEYTLYYNGNASATENDEGWIQIPNKSAVTDENYNKDGFTYSDIQKIAYEGSLKFTPDRKGAYMIKCVVSSKVSVRAESASEIIVVDGEITEYTPAGEPLSSNVIWSIVFLSVGTICLIAIIILLFTKPKTDVEEKEKSKN